MLNKKLLLIIIFGYGIALSQFLVTYLVFLTAFFNNNIAHVYTNKYGEANLEFILIPICFIFSTIGLYLLMKNTTPYDNIGRKKKE